MIFSIGVGFFLYFILIYIYGKIGVDMLFFVINNNNLIYRMGWEIKLINLIFV